MLNPQIVNRPCPIRRLGAGPAHHFFGYYNKTVWDPSGRYLLAQRVPVMDAVLTPDLVAEVGFFDLQAGDRFHVLDRTRAWNWQMGAQLQWLERHGRLQAIYNCRTETRDGICPGFGSVVCDAESGEKRTLPLPVYVVAPDGRFALCLSYRRLYITHETIGYPEGGAPANLTLAPADDGIHYLDIERGESRLVVSYADLRNFHPAPLDRARQGRNLLPASVDHSESRRQ